MKSKKQQINHVAIVVDKSGSMMSLTEAARRALNKALDDLAGNALKTGQTTLVSLYEFGTFVHPVYQEKPIGAVLNERTFRADMGRTALLDATGRAIEDLLRVRTDAKSDEAYLLIVVTDGEENESHTYDAETLNRLIQKVQATDRWTLTFLLPPGNKPAFCHSFAVPEGNVAEWEQSVRGVEVASGMTSKGIGSYFVARAAGQSRVQNFYTTDASSIKSRDLKKMEDISAEVKVWSVDREVDIQAFVEAKGREYRKGVGFYQLTKTEKKVQDYKRILIMEKGKKAVYEGIRARQLLGLPTVGDVKVIPGNHANFDIFVQSTSTNRKLVRGTKFVLYPGAALY